MPLGLIPPSFVGGAFCSAAAFAQPESKVAIRIWNPQSLSPSLSTQLIAPAFSLPCSHQPLGLIPPSFVGRASYSAVAFAQPASKVALRRRNPPRLSPSLSTQLIAPAFGVDSTILCRRSLLLRRCIYPPRLKVAFRIWNPPRLSPSLSTQLIAPAFGVDSTILCRRSLLLRRCIYPTRIESRDSHMESTKTIALIIHSLAPTSLWG